MADAADIWHGELRRGDNRNEIVGELVDAWGWRVRLHGVRQEGGRYALTGTLDGQVPKGLRQPIDEGG